MKKHSFFRLVSLVFFAHAAFFVCSSPSSYAANANECVNAGNEALGKGDRDQAIKSFNQAISLDAKCSGAYVGLGNSYFEKGNIDQAIKSFDQAASLDAKCSGAYAGLGNSYSQKGDAGKATEFFNKSISLNAN